MQRLCCFQKSYKYCPIGHKATYYCLLLLPIVFWATSCNWFNKNDREEDPIVAQVGEKYLYLSDVNEALIKGASAEDSIEVTKNFIDAWIKRQLILEIAETYLTPEQLDIERRVQDYKESLIIYSYENELIKQKLDTTVNDNEVNAYFEQYEDNFLLTEDIAQFYYVKLPKEAPKLNEARQMFQSNKAEDREQLMGYCVTYAADFYLKDSIWYELSGIYKQIPIDQLQLRTLSKNKLTGEVEDSTYIYLLKFNEFKEQGKPAPLNYIRHDIVKILLNKRKMELVSNTYENLYKDAVENGNFKKY